MNVILNFTGTSLVAPLPTILKCLLLANKLCQGTPGPFVVNKQVSLYSCCFCVMLNLLDFKTKYIALIVFSFIVYIIRKLKISFQCTQ